MGLGVFQWKGLCCDLEQLCITQLWELEGVCSAN